jgi:glycosyltransferase involved in cell wall biosynthesis
VPTYNGSKFIVDCIESIRISLEFANLSDYEILIADNGSIDSTETIIANLRSSVKNINYYRHQENIGFDRNIDSLMRRAKYDHIKLIGDDDQLDHDYIARLVEKLNQFPETDLVMSNFRLTESKIIQNEYETKYFQKDKTCLDYSEGIFGQVSTLTFRRSAFIETNQEIAFDTDLAFTFAVYKIAYSGNVLVDRSKKIQVKPGSPRFALSPEDSVKVPKKAIEVAKLMILSDSKNKSIACDMSRVIKGHNLYILDKMSYLIRYRTISRRQLIKLVFPNLNRHIKFYLYLPLLLIFSRKQLLFTGKALKFLFGPR